MRISGVLGLLIGIAVHSGCAPEREEVASRSSPLEGTWTTASTTLGVARGLFSTELRNIAVGDGRVLVVGGGNMASRTTVDILNATTGARSMGSPLTTAREMFGTIALADGGALVAGGQNRMGMTATILASAERWDPDTGAFTVTANSLNTARAFHSATLLSDGRVFLVGGLPAFPGPGVNALASSELFDPDLESFTTSASLTPLGRFGHVAAIIPDNPATAGGSDRVIIIGGNVGVMGSPPMTTQIFDPDTGMFTNGPMMKIPRIAHAGARLLDGRILYCGGCMTAMTEECDTMSHTTCEIYDPAGAGSIDYTDDLEIGGSADVGGGALSLVTLATGKVLLIGGISTSMAQTRTEVFDPETETWDSAGDMTNGRYDAGIALLRDGRAIVAGGRSGPTASSTYINSIEIYTPAGTPVTCRVCQLDGTCVTLFDGTTCVDGVCTDGECGPPVDGGVGNEDGGTSSDDAGGGGDDAATIGSDASSSGDEDASAGGDDDDGDDGDDGDDDDGDGAAGDGGGGCAVGTTPPFEWFAVIALALLALARRRARTISQV